MKSSELGKSIFDPSVEDEIVIDVIKRRINEVEKEGKDWVIEGFPRTKVQAMSLQKMGVIPDKILYLQCDEETSINRLVQE
jgi:adenylate kinase